MRKLSFRLFYPILVFSLVACAVNPEESLCSVEVVLGHEDSKGLDKSISFSMSSELEYEYKAKPYNTEDSDGGWTVFDFNRNLVLENLKPGLWTFTVRAVKDGEVYYQGSSDISLSGSTRKSVRIVLKKTGEKVGKGTLIIRDSCEYEGLTVKLRFSGTSEENRTCPGVAEYSKSLNEGYYSVSIVYYKNSVVVGGYGFAVYIPAYETVSVSLNTTLASGPVETSVDFINFTAPYVSGKVCTGYTKDGAEVDFPYTVSINAGEKIDADALGFVPVYVDLSDMDTILASDYVELWAKDLPYNGFFSGDKRLHEKTPKIIVLNADAGRIGHACLSYLRDLETAYLKGVVTISESTFMNCYNLREVYFSDSFLNFNFGPFENCTSLTDLYFARPDSTGMSFPNSWNYNAPANINLHYGVSI